MTESLPTDAVLVDRPAPHIMRVTLNRPEVRNAINGAVAQGLEAAVDQAEADDAVRVVLLAAAGDRSFCAGADLAAAVAGKGAELSTERGGFAGFVRAPRTKPWIAVVNSNALGGGLELCLSCDMIVCSTSARFGLPEVKRGIFAGAGGVFRLPRAIPRHVAFEMIATGEPIDAERAYALGLVNRVFDDGELMDRAIAFAATIIVNAPVSVRQSLVLARLSANRNEAELWAHNEDTVRIVMRSEDSREGQRAFVEKRTPNWAAR
jgi:enoyl-CoA hydratase/carnithine racemase